MVGSCEHGTFGVPSDAGNFLTALGPVCFTKTTLLHVVSYVGF